MAIVKLTDILPLETSNLKESGRKPRKTKASVYKYTQRAWNKKLYEFLKFCGWTESTTLYDTLVSPNSQLEFTDGEFYDNKTYNSVSLDIDDIECWFADDVNMTLFSDSGNSGGLRYSMEITLR